MDNNQTNNIEKHLIDLADRAYQRNLCTFSNFMGLAELDIFHRTKNNFSYVEYELFGGYAGAERLMVRFGEAVMPWPMVVIHVTPSAKKFADELSHRDFLGAVINLGVNRDVIGDIIIKDNEAFIFSLESMADFLADSLNRVKHTTVKTNVLSLDELEPSLLEYLNKTTQKNINVASLRLDAVISEVYNLSRSQAQKLFHESKVFVNGKMNTNSSYNLKSGDVVTCRGYGRFTFNDTIKETKKGRLVVSLSLPG